MLYTPLPIQDPPTSSKFNRVDSPKTTQSQGAGQGGGHEGEGNPNNEQSEMLSVNQNGTNFHTAEPIKEPFSPSPQLDRKRQPIVIHLRKNQQNLFTPGYPGDINDPDFQRSDESLPSVPSPQQQPYGSLHYRTPITSFAGPFPEHKHAFPLSAHSEIHEDENDFDNEDYIVHAHSPLQEIELGQTNEEGEQNNDYDDDSRFDKHVSRTVESYI